MKIEDAETLVEQMALGQTVPSQRQILEAYDAISTAYGCSDPELRARLAKPGLGIGPQIGHLLQRFWLHCRLEHQKSPT